MTPEAAKKYAIELIEAHAAVNGSYTANAGIAKAAAVASVVIDLADQLEQAQTELAALKRELHPPPGPGTFRPGHVVRSAFVEEDGA